MAAQSYTRSNLWQSSVAIAIVTLVFLASGCAPAVPRISGTAYYVDCAQGEDDNSGTSALRPWRTLDKVNAKTFTPGDGIFFRRGTICPGALQPAGSGADTKPITIGAYSRGLRPIIDGGKSEAAFLLFNQQYWHIQDIEFTGGTVFGIHITGDDTGGRLNHFRLTYLVVHDVYGGEVESKVTGLVVLSSGGENNTLNDVVVDGVTAYNTNQWGGIVIAGLAGDYRSDPPVLSTNVIVRNSTVHDVYGDGIMLWGVQNGLIETNLAYETGLQPPPPTIGTPSSIWTWMCHDCTVQYNESYGAHSPGVDGGAFDVDWGTKNNLYQYNYGHNTDSYCFSVFGAGGLTTSDTFYWDPPSVASALVNQATFTGKRPNFFKNNIVFSTPPWMISTNTKLDLDYNLYWYPGDKQTTWLYGDGVYYSFTDYQNGTKQDIHSLFADPMLNEPSYHEVGKPKTAFTLLAGSPAIDAGNNLGDIGGLDFFGERIPYGAGYDIGASEWQGENTSQSPLSMPDIMLTAIVGGYVHLSAFAGEPILVSFLDPRLETTNSQLVFLRSIAQQYSLHVIVVVPPSSLSSDDLANFTFDWQDDFIRVYVDDDRTALAFGVQPQTTALIQNGDIVSRWVGWASSYALATAIQNRLGLSLLAGE